MVRARWMVALVMAAGGTCLAQGQDDAGYRAATGLLHRDLPEQAVAEYRAFLKEHPGHAKAASARYGLAVALSRLSKWKEAVVELEVLGEPAGFEFAPDALLLRAQCAVQDGDSAGAQGSLRRLLEGYPKFEQGASAAGMLGELLYQDKKLDEAKRVLSRVAAEWPTSDSRPRAEFFLAAIDAGQGRDQEAAERLAGMRKEFPKSELASRAALSEAQSRHRLALAGAKPDAAESERAVRLYRAAAGDEGIRADAMLGLAQLTRASGDAKKAGAILDELMAKPGVSEAVLVERARAYLDEGKADRALAVVEPAAKTNVEAMYWAAKAEMRLSKFESAATRLERAIEKGAESGLLPQMMFDRAAALSRAGKGKDAEGAYAAVREKFPKHALAAEAMAAQASLSLAAGDASRAALLGRGFLNAYPAHERAGSVRLIVAEAEGQAGDPARAADELKVFLAENRDDPRAGEAAVRRGLLLAQAGKGDDAKAALGEALGSGAKVDPALRRAGAMVLADAAIGVSDWAGAEKWLKEVVASKEAQTGDAVLKLGVCLARRGQGDEALAQFENVIAAFGSDPAAVQARFERGQILLERGNLDLARRDFEAVLALEEKAGAAKFGTHCLRHLASIASKEGKSEEAARLLAKVAGGAGGEDARYDLAAALLSAGKYEEAEGAFAKFIEGSPSHPRVADAKAQRAIAVSRLGKLEDALEAMKDAEGASVRPDVLVALRYERAWALKELGKVEEARAAYRALLGQPVPATIEAHGALDLAQLEVNAGQFAVAGELAGRALKAATGSKEAGVAARAMYVRAVSELKLDRAAEALATCETLLKAYGDSDVLAPAEMLAGQAALKAGKSEVAAGHLQRAIEKGVPTESEGAALLCLGDALAGALRWEGSRAAFEKYLKRGAKEEVWFQAQFGIGWALENQGRHAEAISAYREVVGKHNGPTAARAQFQVGECLFAMKQYDEAARELLKVDILYAYPEWSAAAIYEAGRCLMQLNKNAEAQAQFKQVMERFKDTQWAKLAADQVKVAAPPTLPGRASADR